MITALVLACLAVLLILSLPGRPLRAHEPGPPRPVSPGPPWPMSPAPPAGTRHPESMTAELEPWEEEYLAFLADHLWPEDEYLDLGHSIDYDADGDWGGPHR